MEVGKCSQIHFLGNTTSTLCCRQTMLNDLKSAGINCTIILDSAIGYVMEQVDFVMVGAEGVVESGGIINKVFFFVEENCNYYNAMLFVVGWLFYNGCMC